MTLTSGAEVAPKRKQPMAAFDINNLVGVTAVWKCGVGELQLVISFTTIEWNLEASVCFEMLRRPYSIVIDM